MIVNEKYYEEIIRELDHISKRLDFLYYVGIVIIIAIVVIVIAKAWKWTNK